MIEIERASVREKLLEQLSQVPGEAARISGPRARENDLSYDIWQNIKHLGSGVDFEQPVRISEWRTMRNFADREFEALMACTDTKYQHELLMQDRRVWKKNRYSNILAFEHSRVHLEPSSQSKSGDPVFDGYINANFVDGPLGLIDNRKIIASQGPLETTFTDFWRMVAQENVTLIVTTVNVMEKGQPKCFQFWPNEPFQTSESDAVDEQFWLEEMN